MRHQKIDRPIASYRRLCIYFFYDPDGIVDEFIVDCLKEMTLHVEQIIFVSNSRLTPASKRLLASLGKVKVSERLNTGFDVWAYKHGIDMLGWKKIISYDEVIFMNFTIVGPLRPYKEMFDEMQSRSDDFWGVNVHSGEPYDPWGIFPEGFIPKHIQSHFIAVRKRMLSSSEFQEYWDTMRPINSYKEAIAYHEAVFTPKFEGLGFTWSSYIDTSDLESITSYPLMFMPKEVILNRRAPFFKRKSLLLPIEEYLGPTMAEVAAETLTSLKAIGYDIAKVLPNILRTGNQYDVRTSLNANMIVNEAATRLPPDKMKVVIYLDSLHKLLVLRDYLKGMIANGMVQIILGPRSKSALRRILDEFPEVVVGTGGYNDFMSAIERARHTHEIIGVISFSSFVSPTDSASELELYRYGLESLFAGQGLMAGMFERLSNEAFVGALAAPQTLHGHYGGEQWVWKKQFRSVERIVRQMGIPVLMRVTAPPLTSESGMFWVKASALSAIDWKKLRTVVQKTGDRQMATLFNLSLPYFIQGAGMLMQYAMPARIASNLLTVLGSRKLQQERDEVLLRKQLVEGVPEDKIGPASLYYENGKGKMSEKYKMEIVLSKRADGSVVGDALLPAGSAHIRFDPVEARGVICKKVRIAVNGSARKIVPLNAIDTGDSAADLFLTNDPMYAIEGGVQRGDRVTISMKEITYLSPIPVEIAPTILGNAGTNQYAGWRLRRFLTRGK
jgi:lipopolysaccharide biosynthesis protein